MMKISEVTQGMIDSFNKEFGKAYILDAELEFGTCAHIVSAVNAILGDETPVTAELLKTYGYYVAESGWIGSPQTGIEDSKAIDFEYNEDKSLGDCILSSNQSRVNSDEIEIDIKTLGQLRAWHFAIGQPLKETSA